MNEKNIKTIISLGPSTKNVEALKKIKAKGVDFVRINMSHSNIEDLKYFIYHAKQINLKFVLDTEGPQIRTGDLVHDGAVIEVGENVKIVSKIDGDVKNIVSIKPGSIITQLEAGDLMHIGPDTLILKITNTTTINEGYITGNVIIGGELIKNKAVVIRSGMGKSFFLPPLSEKDYESINVGLKENVKYIAASFIRSGSDVEHVRCATRGKMKVISKVECSQGLKNIDKIVEKTDYILIDRGDLSKDIPIERVPFAQKIIIEKAKEKGKGVFVATNLLETMVDKIKPTRAEINDIINTILDGAEGLTLSAETAIGKYPMECINTLNKVVQYTQSVFKRDSYLKGKNKISTFLQSEDYFEEIDLFESLTPPNGGKLINRAFNVNLDKKYIESLHKITISNEKQIDVEQIGTGAYSPLEGFMTENDFYSVLKSMRLPDNTIFPIPIILDVSEEVARNVSCPSTIGLMDDYQNMLALMHVSDIFSIDKDKVTSVLYEFDRKNYPGIKMIKKLNSVLLGGKIDLLKRRFSPFNEYMLTPLQIRALFDEMGWYNVACVNSNNIIQKDFKYEHLKALEENCDGFFVHPLIFEKKEGDLDYKKKIKNYIDVVNNFFPKKNAIFSVFANYYRYWGARDIVFGAICRQNFGCSHFVLRGNHAEDLTSCNPGVFERIFEEFPDLVIKVVHCDKTC